MIIDSSKIDLSGKINTCDNKISGKTTESIKTVETSSENQTSELSRDETDYFKRPDILDSIKDRNS